MVRAYNQRHRFALSPMLCFPVLVAMNVRISWCGIFRCTSGVLMALWLSVPVIGEPAIGAVRIARAAGSHIHPSIARTPAGVIVVIYGQVNHRDLRISLSEDGGRTWTEPSPYVHTAGRTYYPGSLTTLRNGTLLHAWNRWAAPDNEEEPRSVVYSLSDDGGTKWGPVRPAPSNPQMRSVIRHPVTEWDDEHWLMTLTDRTALYDPQSGAMEPIGDGRLHGIVPLVRISTGTLVSGTKLRSTDNGLNWAEIPGSPDLHTQGWHHDLVCLANGWLLASEILGPGFGGERINYVISYDDGLTWTARLTIHDPGRAIGGRACPRAVQLDVETIGVVFYDISPQQPGGPGLFFLRIPLRTIAELRPPATR